MHTGALLSPGKTLFTYDKTEDWKECLAQDPRVNQWWHLSGPWDQQAALQPGFKPQINCWSPHESNTVSGDLAIDE